MAVQCRLPPCTAPRLVARSLFNTVGALGIFMARRPPPSLREARHQHLPGPEGLGVAPCVPLQHSFGSIPSGSSASARLAPILSTMRRGNGKWTPLIRGLPLSAVTPQPPAQVKRNRPEDEVALAIGTPTPVGSRTEPSLRRTTAEPIAHPAQRPASGSQGKMEHNIIINRTRSITTPRPAPARRASSGSRP